MSILILVVSCCVSTGQVGYTDSYETIQAKNEYVVRGYNNAMRIYVFDINDHEYIGNVYSDTFIHSPNCKCHKEKETCTSSDLLSQPLWY